MEENNSYAKIVANIGNHKIFFRTPDISTSNWSNTSTTAFLETTPPLIQQPSVDPQVNQKQIMELLLTLFYMGSGKEANTWGKNFNPIGKFFK